MELEEKILAGHVLGREEGLSLFALDLLTLGRLAHRLRRELHPVDRVTFVVDRNINYTNICSSRCLFCAFYRNEGDREAYLLSYDEIGEKIEELLEVRGTQLLLQGGLHPGLGLSYYVDLFQWIKESYPIHLHALSPPEILHISQVSQLCVKEVITELRKAGLDSIPGGGAEILVDRVRREISPNKISADSWLQVMEEAHNQGLRSTATMMFGCGESKEERVEHLLQIRELQDRTGGFTAFIPWPFQPYNTALGGRPTSGVEYLKTLAIARLMLSNVKNIQASWVTQGEKVGQLALFFGANDFGGTMLEENVVRSCGLSHEVPFERTLYVIREAGFTPVQRDTLYREVSSF